MIIYPLIVFIYLTKLITSSFNNKNNSKNIEYYLNSDNIQLLKELIEEKNNYYDNILDLPNNIKQKLDLYNLQENSIRFLGNSNNTIKSLLEEFIKGIVDWLNNTDKIGSAFTSKELKDFRQVLDLFNNSIINLIDNLNLSDTCNDLFVFTFDKLNHSRTDELTRKFINEIILNLLVNKNDFLGFNKCVQGSNLINAFSGDSEDISIHPVFFFVFVNDLKKNIEFKGSTLIEKYFYTMGLCLLESVFIKNQTDTMHCTEEDYIQIIEALLKVNTYIDNVQYEPFILRDKNDHFPTKEIWKHLIPFFILLIPLMIKIFLFSCQKLIIKKRKKGTICRLTDESTPATESDEDNVDNGLERKSNDSFQEKKNDENLIIIIPTWYKLLKDIFNLGKNGKELFNLSDKNFNNNLGLSYTNALIGISMFLTVIGQTYFVLFNLPIKNFGIWSFYNTIYFPLYFFIFIGLRYSPRVIFSCSGYTLAYKYLSFIAKKPGYYYGKFMLLQIYKYFILIIIILFVKYSLYHLQILISQNVPTWEIFLKKVLQKPESKTKIFLNFITFKIFDIKIDHNRLSQDIFSYFWIPLNEMFFFIFGITLITLGHSCRISIDYVIIVLILFFYLGKIIYYYAYYHHKEKIYTTLYYYMFEYGKLMLNPLFNLPYFLIGLYFGLINYSIQRGISESNRDSDYSRICNNKENEYEQKLTYKNTNRIFKANTDDDNDFARDSINLDDEEEEVDDKKMGKIFKSNTELQKLEVKKKESSKSTELKNKNPLKFDMNKGDFEKNNESGFFTQRDSDDTNSLLNEEINEMPFLKAPTVIKLFMRKTKKNSIYIFILIFGCLFIMMFPLVHYIFISIKSNIHFSGKKYKKDELIKRLSLEKVIPNKALNFFYLIDIELVIFFLQSGFFILYMRGQETINEFFSHIYWSFFNKIYFAFILVLNPIILYNFYHSDNIIKLNTYTIYVYSFINMIVIVFFMVLCYIYLELPLKKLFKYLIRKYEIAEEESEEEESDDNEGHKLK